MTHYSKEFKDQALKLSDDIGLKRAAEQLGIKYGILAGWRKNRANKKDDPVASNTAPMTEQEKQLMKENQELQEANEILKDALGFSPKTGRSKY